MSVKINGFELPTHVSYSSFTTWLDCGFKYYLSRVEGHRGHPSWWLVGGSALHTASEEFDKAYFEEVGQ
jgi:CRISPR/Cas system-associated exonuclease Cas4 (RecB family)